MSARNTLIDINLSAIYVMIKGDPGIGRARLYKNTHGREILDLMVARGLVATDGHGHCRLTERGEEFGLALRLITRAIGEEEQIEKYTNGLIDWYQDKIEANRIRGRRQ